MLIIEKRISPGISNVASNLRTGSVGNRSAEDMVNTLVKEKKEIISSVRKRLLDRGYLEEVEYDSINIEPVLIYSKSEKDTVFVRHKWEMNAAIAYQNLSESERENGESTKFLIVDENGIEFLKFKLPDEEKALLQILDRISSQ